MASGPYGTIYTGHTDSLSKRVRQHKEMTADSFTARYRITQLVWLEGHDTREGAFRRERQIKGWRRKWKIAMWRDLYDDLNNLLVL